MLAHSASIFMQSLNKCGETIAQVRINVHPWFPQKAWAGKQEPLEKDQFTGRHLYKHSVLMVSMAAENSQNIDW